MAGKIPSPEQLDKLSVLVFEVVLLRRTSHVSVANLASALTGFPQIIQQCAANLAGTTPYLLPNPQGLPAQETDTPRRPSGRCEELSLLLRGFATRALNRHAGGGETGVHRFAPGDAGVAFLP